MSQYTSYWLYQKYEKRGDQDWLPCYPNVLSVDADGTRQRVIKEENDTGCGYTPEPGAEYRWIQVPISEDYICDYCPIYRWHEAPVTDYYCSGTTKWTKEYYQCSLDNGVTWNNVVPEQTRKGNTIIAEESVDCGYVPPVLYEWRRITPVSGDASTFICDNCCDAQYRWINLDPTVDYYCSGTTKYYKQQKQVSVDCMEHWNWVSPAEYQWGASAQAQSTDCGYVPPTLTFRLYNVLNDTHYIHDGLSGTIYGTNGFSASFNKPDGGSSATEVLVSGIPGKPVPVGGISNSSYDTITYFGRITKTLVVGTEEGITYTIKVVIGRGLKGRFTTVIEY